MKKILSLEKNVFFVAYLIALYVLITIDFVVSDRYLEQGIYRSLHIWETFVISIILALIISVFHYIKHKKTYQGICFQVIEKYAIKDQYERFMAIKECIEKYEYLGKRNLKRNVYVIEASIERDQTYSVVFPIMITVVSALFIEKEIIPITSPVVMLLISLLVLKVVEMLSIIPRNAFIKKVVECIKNERKLQ